MNNTYIPSVLKEKLSLFINYFYGLAHLLFSIFLTISLLSFDINDNSFLTQSNQSASNLGGEIGSYISSFVFYTFGLFGYALIIFFLSISSFAFLKKKIRYLFLRLFLFFISLVLIPQTFLYLNLNINFLEPIEDWGIVSKNLYLIYQHNYISYFLTFIGIILFIACLNIHQYLKLPSLKIPNFAKNENKTPIYPKIKKEPIISQIPTTNINKERISENKNIQKEFSKSNFSSPSLDIL